MTAALQGSLLDLVDVPELGPLAGHTIRTELTEGAWIDLRPNWLTGGSDVFRRLQDEVDWRAERRQMYDRVVDVPRLLRFYGAAEQLPHPVLVQARSDLSRYYAAELGEQFRTAGMCLYRDGRDSVAWHADDRGRGKYQDTMVAILSLGSPRFMLLRPAAGGPSIRRLLAHGDLIVMGGSCQRTWEHAIPKTAKPVGPRMSIQFRPLGVS
ncbi:MAG TPA: alpha-ketoglutarate-dependent dioxygenase AlkB [Jatrophihabitans sp.]|nr:alpha-ketoglutarate-dependent dioxygenase AlkB [Jatrophihabitans sp.]